MDTFFEQIVSVKKTGKAYLIIFLLSLAALIVSFLAIFFLGSFGILVACGAIYGAFQLVIRQSIEYEYIVTNGSMDVDKIIAQRSRKRELSFEISSVERLEKYNLAAPPMGNFSKTVIACTPNSSDTYFMVVTSEAKGSRLLVFNPDDRLKDAIKKSLPKFIANSAFKD